MSDKKKKTPNELLDYLFKNYELNSAFDIQEALKDIFSDTIEAMLNAELDEHLGYNKSENNVAVGTNRRNGTSSKKVKSQIGEFEIKIPRDRESNFEPKVVEKHQKDISDIEIKILSMYARGQSQREISDTINEIYGFKVSHETVSKITDKIVPLINEFRHRPLQKLYPFIFVDAMYVPVKTAQGSGQKALYNIIGIDLEGRKEVLGFWLSETESAKEWLVLLEELKKRGVEDILFISMDGLKGLDKAVKAIYPKTITQRCIVHLMRNSTKYLARKKWSEFAKDIKAVYKAVSLDEAKMLFENFVDKWEKESSSAVRVWQNNFEAITRLFEYPSEIRKIIYTTNTIESFHNQLRRVTDRKGAFVSEISLYKLVYLKTMKIIEKWQRPVAAWGKVLNQLNILFYDRIEPYL